MRAVPRLALFCDLLDRSVDALCGGCIRYDLRDAQQVSLRIYDVRGRLLVTLIDGNQPAGQHHLVWQGTDEAGQAIASGVYFLRLQLADEEQTQRLSLVR